MKLSHEDAIRQLAALLREENAALAAMDFARAGALLSAKHAAAGALEAAARTEGGAAPDPAALRELGELADENRRLLNRALRIQRRVLDVVAKAARRAAPPAPYGRSGQPETRPPPPRSLVARI